MWVNFLTTNKGAHSLNGNPHTNNKGTSTDVSIKTMERIYEALSKKKKTINKKAGWTGKCWETTLKSCKGGYPQKTYKGTKYALHRIFAFFRIEKGEWYFEKYQPYCKKSKIVSSHLCGNKKCFYWRHLKLEPELYQQTRDCCHAVRREEENLKTKGYRCPHDPVCIDMKGCKD